MLLLINAIESKFEYAALYIYGPRTLASGLSSALSPGGLSCMWLVTIYLLSVKVLISLSLWAMAAEIESNCEIMSTYYIENTEFPENLISQRKSNSRRASDTKITRFGERCGVVI